jgi:hypothetical protein
MFSTCHMRRIDTIRIWYCTPLLPNFKAVRVLLQNDRCFHPAFGHTAQRDEAVHTDHRTSATTVTQPARSRCAERSPRPTDFTLGTPERNHEPPDINTAYSAFQFALQRRNRLPAGRNRAAACGGSGPLYRLSVQLPTGRSSTEIPCLGVPSRFLLPGCPSGTSLPP